MSKRCINLFKISDFTSGGVFILACLAAILSFFVPHIMLVIAGTLNGFSLGSYGYLYFIAFIGLNYLTFKHKAYALLGHIILIILLVVLGSGISLLYMALLFIYLLPYVCVYREADKHSMSSKVEAEKREGY